MHGWMDGWMDGWLFACLHAYVCRVCVCLYVCMYVCMDGWMDGWMDGCLYVHVYMCICAYVCMYMYIHRQNQCVCIHTHTSIYLSPVYTAGLIDSNVPRRARVSDASGEEPRQPSLAGARNTNNGNASPVSVRIIITFFLFFMVITLCRSYASWCIHGQSADAERHRHSTETPEQPHPPRHPPRHPPHHHLHLPMRSMLLPRRCIAAGGSPHCGPLATAGTEYLHWLSRPSRPGSPSSERGATEAAQSVRLLASQRLHRLSG